MRLFLCRICTIWQYHKYIISYSMEEIVCLLNTFLGDYSVDMIISQNRFPVLKAFSLECQPNSPLLNSIALLCAKMSRCIQFHTHMVRLLSRAAPCGFASVKPGNPTPGCSRAFAVDIEQNIYNHIRSATHCTHTHSKSHNTEIAAS